MTAGRRRTDDGGETGEVGIARHRTSVAAELLDHGTPVAGRLDVGGGGAAFVPSEGASGFVIAPEDLALVGPATPADGAIRPEATVRLRAEAAAARHVLRIDANAAWDVVMALVRERSEAGLPEIPVETAAGAVVTPRDRDATDEASALAGIDSALLVFVPFV